MLSRKATRELIKETVAEHQEFSKKPDVFLGTQVQWEEFNRMAQYDPELLDLQDFSSLWK